MNRGDISDSTHDQKFEGSYCTVCCTKQLSKRYFTSTLLAEEINSDVIIFYHVHCISNYFVRRQIETVSCRYLHVLIGVNIINKL